ncbi:methyltransferase domain-containing protein [Pseudoduganella sp. FT25W]|uniref:Methyltransferase domain-containing protein n=1 Tax=Duganella alba TaxID=2666081 RepID=A0A6L5QES5_9BURK|nr:methyltransferase domain-containing protein [Duganella alba]MRX08110.1 methyltransferase domain-containing protein [Duganella alba]MRX16353.1 methyltransferase domain-containing protein [Duganella alba]
MADFQQRDPRSPAFWDERFERNFTPWDKGGVPQALRDFAAGSGPLVTLIPGCGSAYELAFLVGQGWDATAIDFSPAAVAQGKHAAGEYAARVVEADFFAWQPERPLQLIYERAFLCAMPRAMWPQVAARWAQLLAPGALLAGFFFFDEAPKGPPFGISRAQLDDLLRADFDCLADDAVSDSIPVFAGKERWMAWRRR